MKYHGCNKDFSPPVSVVSLATRPLPLRPIHATRPPSVHLTKAQIYNVYVAKNFFSAFGAGKCPEILIYSIFVAVLVISFSRNQ